MYTSDVLRLYRERTLASQAHGLEHLRQCLKELQEAKEVGVISYVKLGSPGGIKPFRWDLIKTALFYHDATYDPMAPKGVNESESAELAICHLEGKLPIEDILIVKDLILATAGHVVPESDPFPLSYQKELMIDCDLAILGYPEKQYNEYCWAVRRQYSMFSDRTYAGGRGSFLSHFLSETDLASKYKRKTIFCTEFFRSRYELSAVRNIIREIKSLKRI